MYLLGVEWHALLARNFALGPCSNSPRDLPSRPLQKVYTFFMPALRPLGYLLLVLALIANGLATGGMSSVAATMATAAAPDASSDTASDHGGCHEQPAPAAPAPTPAPDCCDGAGCTCACIQHAPAVLLSIALPALERFSPPPVLGTQVSWPTAPTAPQLRPPIA